MNQIKRWISDIFSDFHFTDLLRFLAKWMAAGTLTGFLSGSASAFFLVSLAWVTDIHQTHAWLLLLLPPGGAAVSFLYAKTGKDSHMGNNLIIDQVHGEPGRVHFRMAPLVLFGTLVTHLFGGSAGREGTAVQMGASLAERVGMLLKLDRRDRRIILLCGISSGFGAVFGTPLAGTFFAMEVTALGAMSLEALVPCFIAAVAGDQVTTSLWGVRHSHYAMGGIPEFSLVPVVQTMAAGVAFGLAAALFILLIHSLKRFYCTQFQNPALRSFCGGVVVAGLIYMLGHEYSGLSLPLIQDAFRGATEPLAFLKKILLTTLTLGAGFQGGEVTPLFMIGSSLGSTLSPLLHLSPAFLAALGFVAVFCGATNTPLASFVLGIELFGGQGAVYLFLVCLVSNLFSGHGAIYGKQRMHQPKFRQYTSEIVEK